MQSRIWIVARVTWMSVVVRLEQPASTVGVGGAIPGIDRSQHRSLLVDQVDPAQVPTGVTQQQVGEVAISRRDFKTLALQRDGAVALSLTPADFPTKRLTQCV